MAAQIDLVLINPANREQIYQSLGKTLSAIEPPVWAGLMATYARGHGHSVAIIDSCAEALTPQATAERVEALNPKLVAVVVYGQQPSAATQVMPGAIQVCETIKDNTPDQKIIVLGGHAAALPRRSFDETVADYVGTGEGVVTLVDLLAALDSAAPRLDKVRGLIYHDGDEIQQNLGAPLLQNLDVEMPGIAWDLLPMDLYRAHNWHCLGELDRAPYVAMYTTLGCPYKCSFCCIQAPFKEGEKLAGYKEKVNTYRRWSVEQIGSQLDILVNQYGVRNIKMADEMFVLNKHHVIGLCDLIIERGYDLNIWAYSRVDTVKPEMLDKLKAAGFNWLAFGIESGNSKVRKDVDKGIDQDAIRETLALTRSHGIYIIGNYIFGLPEDDLASMQETLDLAMELNCEFGNFYCAMAYPGSPLYDHAIKEGLPLPKSWSGYSQHSVDSLPLATKHVSAGDVLRFRDDAFHEYYSNPTYLNMIHETFGADTVASINNMAVQRLKRDNA